MAEARTRRPWPVEPLIFGPRSTSASGQLPFREEIDPVERMIRPGAIE